MKPQRNGGNSWGDSRSSNNIGLGHSYDRRPDPYQNPPSVWENPSAAYGTASPWSQTPAPLIGRYEYETGYGAPPTRAPVPLAQPLSYREDPYYRQPAAAEPPPFRTNYYDEIDSAPPVSYQPAQYGSYSLAEPISRPAPYPEYNAPRYDSYQVAERLPLLRQQPRPLYDNRPQRRDRGDFFSGRKENSSFVPPKSNPRKRERNPSYTKPPTVNRRSNSSFNTPKNGKSNEKKTKQAAPEAKQDQNDARFLFEKIDNATELFEKCKALGEARHRQFRYKLYRCLNTVGLEFVTITEQKGTFAKAGKLKMKVMLKNFFPQVFVGEANGTEYESTCYASTVKLALKLHEYGLLGCETISNFYNKKLHYKPEKFDQAKTRFQLLVDEIAKNEFTAEFKEGKVESAEQMALLEACIKTVADKLREQEKSAVDQGNTAEVKADANAESKAESKTEESVKPTDAVESTETANAIEPEKPTTEAAQTQSDTQPAVAEEKVETMECTDEA